MTSVSVPPPLASSLQSRVIDSLGNALLRPPLGGLGLVHVHGARSQRRVALTFDDGPNAPSTADVLDILAKHNVRATFFCVGLNALRYPQLVKRAYDDGHVIGNHSMYHRRKAGLVWRDEAHVDDCARVLTGILGVTPRLYRAPWGWVSPWEARRLLARDLSIIGWDVDTYDWRRPSPHADSIAASVQRGVRPGSIVLFHDGLAGWHSLEKPQAVRGVEMSILTLRRLGHEFVTIPELLHLEGYKARQEPTPATHGRA